MELLKISIKARIEDFDRFYAFNFQDLRISFFEKQKFRLRKLLHEANVKHTDEGTERAAQKSNQNELEIKFQIEDDVNVFSMQKNSIRNIKVRIMLIWRKWRLCTDLIYKMNHLEITL